MSQQPDELPGFDALSPQDRAVIKAQLGSPEAVKRLLDNKSEMRQDSTPQNRTAAWFATWSH